jgi:cytochrome P450
MYLYAEMDRRRAEGVEKREDVLSMLMQARDEDGQPMSEQALRDEAITLLAAGHETTATTLSWALHRVLQHPDVEARLRPERFNPERFLGKRLSPYEYFPFGGGARRCIGMAFATYEMRIIFAELLRRVKLRSATRAETRVGRRGVTLAPEGGVPVIVESRS